jgi:hypothetical protein
MKNNTDTACGIDHQRLSLIALWGPGFQIWAHSMSRFQRANLEGENDSFAAMANVSKRGKGVGVDSLPKAEAEIPTVLPVWQNCISRCSAPLSCLSFECYMRRRRQPPSETLLEGATCQ